MSSLKEVRELLSDPARWNKRYLYAKADGTPCWSESAERWCLIGACCHFGVSPQPIYKVNHGDSIAQFNDNATHEEVLALLDKAIEAS